MLDGLDTVGRRVRHARDPAGHGRRRRIDAGRTAVPSRPWPHPTLRPLSWARSSTRGSRWSRATGSRCHATLRRRSSCRCRSCSADRARVARRRTRRSSSTRTRPSRAGTRRHDVPRSASRLELADLASSLPAGSSRRCFKAVCDAWLGVEPKVGALARLRRPRFAVVFVLWLVWLVRDDVVLRAVRVPGVWLGTVWCLVDPGAAVRAGRAVQGARRARSGWSSGRFWAVPADRDRRRALDRGARGAHPVPAARR